MEATKPKKLHQNVKRDLLIVAIVFIILFVIAIVVIIVFSVKYSEFLSLFSSAFSYSETCSINPDRCQYIDTDYLPGVVQDGVFVKEVALFCAQSILNLEWAVHNNNSVFKVLSPLQLVGTFTITSEYKYGAATNNFGYFAFDNNVKNLYIFVRGTQTDVEAKLDLQYSQVSGSYVGNNFNNSLIHKGFSNIFGQIKSQLETLLLITTSTYSTISNIIVSGHSLGGAIASLIAAYLISTKSYSNVYTYTYGKPKVGDPEYCDNLDLITSNFWRVENQTDIVPQIPLAVMPTPGKRWFYNQEAKNITFQYNWESLSLNHYLNCYIAFLNTL